MRTWCKCATRQDCPRVLNIPWYSEHLVRPLTCCQESGNSLLGGRRKRKRYNVFTKIMISDHLLHGLAVVQTNSGLITPKGNGAAVGRKLIEHVEV